MAKVIVAKDLFLGYDKHTVIEKATFSIHSGELIFLTGVSGGGKTTLIKHLYGELRPKRGFLNIGGYNMDSITKSKLTNLRRYIGVVFQDYKLIQEWTIEKNVMLPLIISGIPKETAVQKAHQVLTKVKLSNKLDKYPYELSGGEQQRAAMARAIIHEPVLLLADEPTGNLDDYSKGMVMKLFKLANRLGITTVISTHNLPDDFDVTYRNLHIEDRKIYEIS